MVYHAVIYGYLTRKGGLLYGYIWLLNMEGWFIIWLYGYLTRKGGLLYGYIWLLNKEGWFIIWLYMVT